ncbi:Alpha-ketoglutarate-dependent dioxygenase AlkB [Achromobacter spanius]|uniref:DNA oxidative demethylase AlkB n=1 Tax=Achromobacter spanius TaxID=217203 RepID=UPI000C2C45D2|nr:DNA oxidative demethylase AlkB [Achromobacter spanius]AUA56749.1 DNA oxidative demethylase AlkB [Achromobacter spanius]CAB3642970.1 Alpha-ketoglutarate-dependent dioxygenase AlkB [Achromobacter spanius]SPT42412.1 Alpha-ketoglutarate-dependent dioxygenase AlkB [Achromobacter denitrificans]VEE55634.1 Alpha-ketoglutarate-dependent dioxygenase AlkB [Achromobacter spanius]
MTLELFNDEDTAQHGREQIGPQSFVLRGFALPYTDALLQGVDAVAAQSPFRHMHTPGGYTMSVALTNCGTLGWTSDAHGYRYTRIDPLSGQPWPDLPDAFLRLAQAAAADAGFPAFTPDACLVNRYEPGSRLSLHQDKNERDYDAPIVSVSLGMPALFLFGGHARTDKAARVPLLHGDVVVWGGVDRLRYHGVLPMKDAPHPRLGSQRVNFTLRKAG